MSKRKEKKKKNLQVLEMSFSCFKPFGVWGVTHIIPFLYAIEFEEQRENRRMKLESDSIGLVTPFAKAGIVSRMSFW